MTNDHALNALVQASYNGTTTVAGGSLVQDTFTGNTNAYQQQMLGCVHYWPYDGYYHYWPQPVVISSPPTWCAGNVHVFACEHAEVCRCGKAKREKAVCGTCGK